MMAFLLLVTWLGYAQPPSHYQVEFSSNEVCEAARLKLIKDAERIGQSMIEHATAQDRQCGGLLATRGLVIFCPMKRDIRAWQYEKG